MKHTKDVPAPALDEASAEALRTELRRSLHARTADATVAEDLAQEAMIHVLSGLPRFQGKADLRTWARRIALNVWRDHLRRRAANPVQRAAKGEAFSVLAVLDSMGPTAPGPELEAAYDRKVTHECLLAAARRLPPAEREILLLHDFGAVALERAAAMLSCSLGAAKVRLHRARRHLAETCRADCTGEAASDGSILCSSKAPATEAVQGGRAKKRKSASRRS
jgi:RNA polymerase sigma-70 factor (ECF subfamily)